MRRCAAFIAISLILSSCGQEASKPVSKNAKPSSLEQAAIVAGVIPDVAKMSLAGAFERQSDLGEDRFCAVGDDRRGYQVGMLAVFGPDTICEGLGQAERDGEQIRITLTSEKSCSFTANFDGVELQLPGSLPESCASYCAPRATFAGVSFYIVGEGDAVARSTRGREIDNLCPGG